MSNSYYVHSGGAWNAYTPTLTDGTGKELSHDVDSAHYYRAGRLVCVYLRTTLQGGCPVDQLGVSLPADPVAPSGAAVGTALMSDISTMDNYPLIAVLDGAGMRLTSTPTRPLPPLASGDVLAITVTYEATTAGVPS